MRKVIALVSSLLLVATFATPAQSAGAKYSVYQKTLATFSSSATTLTTQQKSQVKATVEANPTAEKFICTGIRYYDQPMSVNITVRKRAKAACEYAKQLNPALSTWFQNKPTKARSYAGKVLLTLKTVPSLGATKSGEVAVPAVQDLLLSSETVDDEICKLKQSSSNRDLAASFPSLTYEIPHTGKVNVALVFLEWGDLKGTDADYKYWLEQASMFEDFYYMVSEGKLNIEIHQQKQWFEVGPTYVDYKMSQAQDGGSYHSKDIMQKNGDAFIAASDAGTDFSGMDAIIFAIPRAKEVFETGPHAFGHNKQNGLVTKEGTIYDWISAGTWFIDNPGQPSWVYYVHEFGHSLGLVDFRDTKQSGQIIGEKYAVNPMGGYEIMDNQGGPTRTMTAWVRWVQGWLNDSQVLCVDSTEITTNYYKINRLNKVGGATKAVVIKTSSTKAIVIESRRWDSKFDVPVVNSKDGVVIYTVDSTKGHSEGPLRLVSPRDITRYLSEPNTYPDWRTLDAVFYEGDSITVQGVTINVESLSSSGDIVKISN